MSAQQIQPMKVNVLKLESGALANPIFISPYDQTANPANLVGETGPLIMDSAGNPIWFKPLSTNNSVQAVDFQTQTLFGKPVLIWWQGSIGGTQPGNAAPGQSIGGQFVIYNQHYKEIMSIKAPGGGGVDLHELIITPQGDAWFTTSKPVKANLSAYGGPTKGEYDDPVIREVNLRTGKQIWSWNVAKHIPLSDSLFPVPTTSTDPWDAYHINSIDVSPDGSQFLISARNTWGVYNVSRATGQVLYQVGGKQNQFALPSSLITGPYGSAFQYQHDARYVPGGISLFDDAGIGGPPGGGPYGPARGLILNLDVQNETASLAAAYYHDPALYANSQGNFQILGNGNVLVGWGSDTQTDGQLQSYITEYASTGTVLADYVLAGEDITYRAFSQPWVGLPQTRVSAVAEAGNGQTTVYTSWNGSTQTVAWELLAGQSRRSLTPVSVTSRTGFETAITTTDAGPFYKVEALGEGGTILGSSVVVRE